MAAPIIDSVDVAPRTVMPGGQAVITILAHDPDAATANLTGVVTDSAGNTAVFSDVVLIADALTYAVSVDVGTVVQDPMQANVWVYVAPA